MSATTSATPGATPKPFRFAVQAYTATTGREWLDLARRTEALGYSTLNVADHYNGEGPETAGAGPQELAPVPAMAMAAAVTDTLKVGARVFCIDYHVPAVLAREAATLDLLSDGRLELGLGAGWTTAEYEAIGVAMDPVGVRIERLGRVIELMHAYFSGATLDIDTPGVRAVGFRGVPAGSHRPPIMVGGGGRRVLQLAARQADIVSLNFNNRAGVVGPDGVASATAAATDDRIGWIREAAGDRIGDIELEVGAYFTAVTDQATAAAAALGQAFGLSAEDVVEHPNALIGSVAAISDRLVERRERYGITYVTVPNRHLEAFAPVVAELAGS